jgi:hypothetical protein
MSRGKHAAQLAFHNARMKAFGERIFNDAAAMMFGNLLAAS